MNRNTVRNIALGALVLANSLVAISANASTSANTTATAKRSGNRVVQVALSTSTATLEDSILDRVNEYRASKGLKALSRNTTIDSQSRTHSQDMASGSVAFGHNGFKGRVQSTGIPFNGAAENVAYNMGFNDPAARAFASWLKSPGHRKNIEGNFSQTGIGVAVNRKGEIYFTQIFIDNK